MLTSPGFFFFKEASLYNLVSLFVTIKSNTSLKGVFHVRPIQFRPFPFCPIFLPISPFAVSPPTHFALYQFAPLPPRPNIFSLTYHFALLPIHPLPIRSMPSRPFFIFPFTTSPNAILPICHLAPLSFHHSISFSLNLFATAHDSLVLEPKTVTWYWVTKQGILVYSFLEELEL